MAEGSLPSPRQRRKRDAFAETKNQDCRAPSMTRRIHRLSSKTVALLLILVILGSCHGFSTREIASKTRVLWQRQRQSRSGKSAILAREARSSHASNVGGCRRDIDHAVETEAGAAAATAAGAKQNDGLQEPPNRRRFVAQLHSSLAGLVLGSGLAASPTEMAAWAASDPSFTGRIVRLSSGLQFTDQRIGSGPEVVVSSQTATATATNDTTNTNNGVNDPSVLLMHLRALRRDGSVLLDTFEDGKPLLFQVGSISSEVYYLGETPATARGKIPLGVQDAILAQGAASWEGGFGKADPMRQGGIRKVVVPAELAYGSQGVSRYEALQLGLRQPVARNELLRYEIEILRCNDENPFAELATDDKSQDAEGSAVSAKACCLEEFYPCKMNGK